MSKEIPFHLVISIGVWPPVIFDYKGIYYLPILKQQSTNLKTYFTIILCIYFNCFRYGLSVFKKGKNCLNVFFPKL